MRTAPPLTVALGALLVLAPPAVAHAAVPASSAVAGVGALHAEGVPDASLSGAVGGLVEGARSRAATDGRGTRNTPGTAEPPEELAYTGPPAEALAALAGLLVAAGLVLRRRVD